MLSVENEKRVLESIKYRSALEFTRRKNAFLIAHAEDASCGIVVRYRNYQLLGGARFPNEISLEIR